MPLAPAAKSWPRLDGVDLLRGLAILLVLFNHTNMQLLFAHVPYTRGLPPQLVSSLVWNGQYGVQIFFAVSGFLITSTSLRRWGSLTSISPPRFYGLRFARIAPLFLLLLTVLSILHLAHVPGFVIKPQVATLPSALLAALTFRINLLEATRGYLPGPWDILWSLSVEEAFYLFFPLAARFLRRPPLFIALLLTLILLGPFARTLLTHGNEVWHEYSYLGSTDAIAMGSLTALLLPRLRRVAPLILTTLGAALVLLVLLASLHIAPLTRAGLDMGLLALGASLLIAAAALTHWQAPAWLTPLRWVGERSYEIYLTHIFILLTLFPLFLRAGKPLPLVPFLFLAVVVCAALFGGLVARFFSEPLNRLLRQRFGDDHLGAALDPHHP